MLQQVPLLIGLRYIRAKRRNQFISFVSGFSLLGMALGVTALIVILSVMNGLDREIKESVLKAIPHGFIDSDDSNIDWQATANIAESHPDVIATAPYYEDFGLLTTTRGSLPVQIKAIDPESEARVSIIGDYMQRGQLDSLQAGEFGIILGSYVASSLGVTVGDSVRLTIPQVSVTPAGAFPREKQFTVVGRFQVGQLDQELALIHLQDGQRLYRLRDGIQGLHVKVNDIYRAGEIMQTVAQTLPDNVSVRDWTQTQSSLFQAVKMEKIVVFVLLLIIVAIAAFNIISSLVLMVADKRADIAVLRTMGMTARQIMAVFMIQGSTVGMIGLVIGLVLGTLGAFNIAGWIEFFEQLFGQKIFDPSVYYIATVPSQWQLGDTLIVAVVASLLSIGASLYPAYRAAKVAPAEALRYE